MKIAQIAPLYESVPPKLYGGTERVVAHLTDALVELGHEVTLFASADARTRARLAPVRERAIRLDPAPLKSDIAAHYFMLNEVLHCAEDFDILHFHIDLLHFPMFGRYANKCITTLHGRLDLADLSNAYSCWPEYGLVSISDDQRKPLPGAHWLGTVQHGMPPQCYRANTSAPGKYLAFLGRISPEKRPDVAIKLAIASGLPIRLAAKVDKVDEGYFQSCIASLLDHPLVEFIGEIGDADKSEFLGNALALLFPIDWPEPFGLVMIESMACGTPVIAWDCGSVREVIDEGVTGCIVSTVQEALIAIERCANFDRQRIRAVFERRFSAQAMARSYCAVYERLMNSPRSLVRRAIA